MTCERVREQMPECIAGRLDKAAREYLIEHLETCSACRAEFSELCTVWRGLESLPAPEPGREMKSRFLEMLEAYKAGMQAEQPSAPWNLPRRTWWAALWSRPAWTVAFASLLVAAGVVGGRYWAAPHTSGPDVAQLQGQVESLRQLVTLSLLQQESPSARLRGVTYSYQIAEPDTQVEQALLHVVNHDSNVNVRLSAVDALAKYGQDPGVRHALVDALAVQDSPLVQTALIDMLVQLNHRDAVPALQKLAADAQANEVVRQHAAEAIAKLGGSK
jgi:hypothetical protein